MSETNAARSRSHGAWWLWTPQILHITAAVASGFPHEGHLVGNVWALAFLSSIVSGVAISRRRNWKIGTVALLFPLLVLAIQVAVSWGRINIGWASGS